MSRLELQYGRVGREHPVPEKKLEEAFHRGTFDEGAFGASIITHLRETQKLTTEDALRYTYTSFERDRVQQLFDKAKLSSIHIEHMLSMIADCEDPTAALHMREIASNMRGEHPEVPHIDRMVDAAVVARFFVDLPVEEKSYFMLFYADFYEDEAEFIEEELGPELDDFFMEQIAPYVEQGIIPLSLDEIHKRVRQVRIRPFDPRHIPEKMGQHGRDSSAIYINTALEEEDLRSTYVHEMLHNISAVAYTNIAPASEKPKYISRQGGLKEYSDGEVKHGWLDEAVTEGFTARLTQESDSDRALLLEQTESYEHFCRLLEALLQGIARQREVSVQEIEKKVVHAYVIPAHEAGETIDEIIGDLTGEPELLTRLDRFIQQEYLPLLDTKYATEVEETLDQMLGMLEYADWKGIEDLLSEDQSEQLAA